VGDSLCFGGDLLTRPDRGVEEQSQVFRGGSEKRRQDRLEKICRWVVWSGMKEKVSACGCSVGDTRAIR
jgi:hypothetical protein